MIATLTIFSRRGCHLCDVMIDEVREVLGERPIRLTVVDVDSDPVLAERYGARVPVLVAADEEVCHYRLARDRLASVLSGA